MKNKDILINGMNNYIERIKRCEDIYLEILNNIPDNYNDTIYRITDRNLFNKVMYNFVTALSQKEADGDLMNIYDVAVHTKTNALIIANKGATLYSLTEKYETPHLVRHIGMCIYMPGIGMEYANAGIVGNIYDKEIVSWLHSLIRLKLQILKMEMILKDGYKNNISMKMENIYIKIMEK